MRHETRFRVALDHHRVSVKVVKGDGKESGEHHQAKRPSRGDWNIRNVLRDDYAERICSGAGPTDSVRNPDHAHRDDCIHTHRQAHCHDNGYQRHILFTHADRVGAKAEHDEATSNKYPRALAEFRDCLVQHGIDCTALPEDGDYSAHEEDQEDNILGCFESLGYRKQKIPGLNIDLLFRGRLCIGLGDNH